MGCDGNGVGGSMELLKAFKSLFTSEEQKTKIFWPPIYLLEIRFNFLRLP